MGFFFFELLKIHSLANNNVNICETLIFSEMLLKYPENVKY